VRPVRIVYEGPGLAGKTCSITYVEKTLRGHGVRTRYSAERGHTVEEVLTVEGQPVVLAAAVGPLWLPNVWDEIRASADAIVFVVDSQIERMMANEDRADAIDATRGSRPICIEWNKRDVPNALPLGQLRKLNRWDAPEFETIAPKGVGVLEAFRAALALAQPQ